MPAKTISRQSRNAVVLMAEDNDDHAFLARESFKDACPSADLHIVPDGLQCMAFLRREPPYENAPRPDLLLLDIHMPKMDGSEVMEAIQKDPGLNQMTVVALSTSSDRVDVRRMYALGCRSYLVKPVEFDDFTKAISQLTGYWFELVAMPQ
jgi:two-component system, chemotaxis family, response regulator Rcp1